ncbi:MAG TPA: HD domain-containing phosphohydrolase [Gemmatimonadaceae bacterium]|nr:HD domain-containing phosphohydrolase [Gemmatimonadaceae bacterium]
MNLCPEALSGARILVVDDEETNLRLLRRILEKSGYRNVITTLVGSDVQGLVHELSPELILLDLHMPHPDGFEILRSLKPLIDGPGLLPVLVLTGDSSAETKRSALSLGARDFLAKPFDATEALLRIRNLLDTRRLYTALGDQNTRLESRVLERTFDLKKSELEILERLARACEIRDDETGRHTQRVGEMAAAIAAAMGMDAHFVELIRRTAPLHDIGKMGIADSILLKPGVLTPEETCIMRTHTTIGARILSGGTSELMVMAECIAHSHHERWDGMGYPNCLSGDDIPAEARIVAVADTFDALSNNRPYRVSLPLQSIVAELRRESGLQFDPYVVDAMLDSGLHRRVPVSPPHSWPALMPDRMLQMEDRLTARANPVELWA